MTIAVYLGRIATKQTNPRRQVFSRRGQYILKITFFPFASFTSNVKYLSIFICRTWKMDEAMKYTKQKLTKAQKQGILDRDKYVCIYCTVLYCLVCSLQPCDHIPCSLVITYCLFCSLQPCDHMLSCLFLAAL